MYSDSKIKINTLKVIAYRNELQFLLTQFFQDTLQHIFFAAQNMYSKSISLLIFTHIQKYHLDFFMFVMILETYGFMEEGVRFDPIQKSTVYCTMIIIGI